MSLTNISNDEFLKLTYPKLRVTYFTLDENLPPLELPLPLKCNKAMQPHSHVNRNSLNVLPTEVLHSLISHLDIRTLVNFRRACRSTHQLVESHLQYQAVNTHARDALRGILSIETGQWITCEMLYTTLCTADCEQCGEFGGFIYLLTCKRVCFRCFTQQKRYLPLYYGSAIRIFGLSRGALDTLPQMKSLPGTYSPKQMVQRDRLTLVDYESAQEASIKIKGSLSSVEKEKNVTSPGPSSRRVLYIGPSDKQSSNPLRFMAVVKTPLFNRSSLAVEPAYYCLGCKSSYASSRPRNLHFRRLFTVHTFGAHLRECGNIIGGKHQSGRTLEAS